MLRASIAIPPEALALELASSAVPGIEVEAERIAAHSTEWMMPCLWIADAEFDAVEAALQSVPSIDEIVATCPRSGSPDRRSRRVTALKTLRLAGSPLFRPGGLVRPMTNENISQDIAFRLLSHVYRRALLECLDRHDAPVSVADAAADVARACNETAASDVSDEEIERISRSLHHSHVPRLAARGAVTYDRDRKVVTLTERGERIITVHDRVSADDPLEVTDAGG